MNDISNPDYLEALENLFDRLIDEADDIEIDRWANSGNTYSLADWLESRREAWLIDIFVAPNRIAELKAENAALKASRERLRQAFFTACCVADDRGMEISENYPPMMTVESLLEMGIRWGDLADADPAPKGGGGSEDGAD